MRFRGGGCCCCSGCCCCCCDIGDRLVLNPPLRLGDPPRWYPRRPLAPTASTERGVQPGPQSKRRTQRRRAQTNDDDDDFTPPPGVVAFVAEEDAMTMRGNPNRRRCIETIVIFGGETSFFRLLFVCRCEVVERQHTMSSIRRLFVVFFFTKSRLSVIPKGSRVSLSRQGVEAEEEEREFQNPKLLVYLGFWT